MTTFLSCFSFPHLSPETWLTSYLVSYDGRLGRMGSPRLQGKQMQDTTPERKDVVKGAIKSEASEVQTSSRIPSSPSAMLCSHIRWPLEHMGSPRSQGKQMQETTPERKDVGKSQLKQMQDTDLGAVQPAAVDESQELDGDLCANLDGYCNLPLPKGPIDLEHLKHKLIAHVFFTRRGKKFFAVGRVQKSGWVKYMNKKTKTQNYDHQLNIADYGKVWCLVRKKSDGRRTGMNRRS